MRIYKYIGFFIIRNSLNRTPAGILHRIRENTLMK